MSKVFSEITAEPVAAASLGQVYKATLRDSGDEVAVKVQRPFVLETVSLDLHLARMLGLLLRKTPISQRIDVVGLLDEFAANFYQELDYELECANGIRVAEVRSRASSSSSSTIRALTTFHRLTSHLTTTPFPSPPSPHTYRT